MRLVLVLLLALVVGCGAPQPRAGGPASGPSATPEPPSATVGPDPLAPPPASQPAALAAGINHAERLISSPTSPAMQVVQAGEFMQLAVRSLVEASASARHQVLVRLDERARAVTGADLSAAKSLGRLTSAQPALPTDWRIVAPLPASTLRKLYQRAQRRTGVPWEFLAAVNFVETRFGRIVGPSTAGAQGPMQFMPSTWAEYGGGGDVRDPRAAIPAAARFLAASGAPHHMAAALRAYNDSPSYVRAVTAYASVMRRWPREFVGYRAWRVLYRARRGTFVLPEGYPSVAPIPLGQ